MLIRRCIPRLAALTLIVVAYNLTKLPDISQAERVQLASNFKFERIALPQVEGQTSKSLRKVNPSVQHISAWISALGAAVALNDLDADGLPNDVAYVDPRVDQVIIGPAPHTPDRYEPFALDGGNFHDPATMAPMGSVPADLNEDGLMDLLVYYWGRTPLAFLRKQSSVAQPLSAAQYVVREILSTGDRWYTNAVTIADIDGDGHADILAGNYLADGLQLLDVNSTVHADMQHSMSRAFNGGGIRFLRFKASTSGTNPNVQYELVAGAINDDGDGQLSHGWTLAIGAADLDGDLLPEIYLANDFGPDRLLHNRSTSGHIQFNRLEGTKTLTTASSKVLGRDSFKGMGVDFADLNGDGLLDIVVSNITAEYALQESHFVFVSTGETSRMQEGVAPYIDRSESLGLSRSGWAWDVKLGDFDNDGKLEVLQAVGLLKGNVNRWPELHELAIGNDQILRNPAYWPRFQPGDALSDHDHNPFFVLGSDNRFHDLAPELGLAERVISRGIATADVDSDGRLDFAVANQWSQSYLYYNNSAIHGSFLGLRLRLPVAATNSPFGFDPTSRGAIPSRPATGAQAQVQLSDGCELMAQVDSGNGHSGKRSQDLLFGLGALPSDAKLTVTLKWRDPMGNIRSSALQLSPGWHTILLE